MNWRTNCRAQREKTTGQRFWEKVRKTDSCWEWTACKDKNGYGFFRHEGKNLKAHRFVLELIGKRFSKKAQVCHSCDNPSCVNPKHLWIGDNKSNQIDSSLKGRQGSQKLTAVDVREIRRRRAGGETGASLAREFSLSGSGYVRNIVVGRKWAHVDQS
jgi:hypothetical protein